jgi:5-carboxymethyl-2-hydroxymuconic-semialdehyde dehydrogenase/aminomuconate-semialdehyde/2-hydroxymuconate-6-semialdehyde dehydrogenase
LQTLSPQASRVSLPAPALAPVGAAPAGAQTLINAVSEAPFAYVPDVGVPAAEAMAARARTAFESGPWRRMSVAERGVILRRISELVLAHAEELAVLHTLETAVPIGQARGMHVPRTAENFSFFADILTGLAGETYDQSGRYLSIVTREPVGVGLVIAPWNAPLVLSSMKLAACIALGNCCIVKPSEYAPLSVLRLGELIQEAGMPADVVQIACGPGATTGRALVRHKDVDAVGLIGGTVTGRRIMADAADGLKKLGLELGGKSANIVLASADFDRALDGALAGIFANNGEQCMAGSRILVEDAIADRFIEAFVARTEKLRVGDPFEATTEIGPIAFKAHYDRMLAFAETARTSSAYRVLAGARGHEGFDTGYFFAPTVVETDDNMSPLCQEEIFGPFVTIQRVRDLDDALARANQSEFGLASYVWSDDLPSVMRARKALRAGTVWVNTPMARDLRAPFGGYKQSGIGRDGLPGSIDLFTEEKSTIIPDAPLNLPKFGASPR